ncbi:MAG: hypothetical protein KA533_03595 [Sphingobium sp.]|nr:hypothetical protein [Sphingobium sp.]MBP6112350.1 hypothetical protein [Sphingobium sp.]MBP8670504.1 hypothetical protein [Sphingobium sp.]MBP9157299.1 hypothetical protein [Sphingobium sp.]MCC6482552.1 hypothetical protein [Sphingomonadaceae bacterium]
MRRGAQWLALALLLSPAASGAMRLGVNTHFDQGWPLVSFEDVATARAQGIRDTISWGKVERTPGVYDFAAANSGYVGHACAIGMPVLLTLTPRNKTYDGGETVYSSEGRKAFAAFAEAVAGRFPCITALEIGNEINGHALKGRMTAQMPQSYIAIVRAVHDAVKPKHPRIRLLSGSSLSVATGFFDRLFGAGLLPLVDGVVVHPYLSVPEQLPAQLARLRQAMTRHGAEKPVWASEFGYYYATPQAAPPHALKLVTLLSAAGVEEAHWYALRDEPYYPNMGLFKGRAPKPALDMFRASQSRLLPAGDARRQDISGDPLSFIYRFGSGPYVVWGAARAIRWTGAARARDARGRPIALPDRLEDDPVIVDAPGGFTLGAQTVWADTLTDFAGARWSYHVARAKGSEQPLGWVDWNWTPYIGARQLPNFRATSAVVTTAKPAQGDASALIERYAAPGGERAFLSACFEAKPARAQTVRIVAQGKLLFSALVSGTVRTPPLLLPPGAAVDILYIAQQSGGAQPIRRRIRILGAADNARALCAPSGRDGGGEVPQPEA